MTWEKISLPPSLRPSRPSRAARIAQRRHLVQVGNTPAPRKTPIITATCSHPDGQRWDRSDAQYIVWRDLFARACDEEPAGRQDRLRFFGRLLSGLANTEGAGAGRRLVPAFLDQAAQAGPAWAIAAAERMDEIGLVSWPDLVAGLLSGLVKQRPELSASAGVVFGRVALPFTTEHDGSIYPTLIRAALVSQLETVVRHALTCIETDAHAARRILQRDGDAGSAWGAVRALERLAPKADYDALRSVFDAVEMLKSNTRAIDAMAQAAMAAGRQADAASYLLKLKEAAEDGGAWGSGWIENTKRRYHRLNVQLRGEAARQVAFDSFVDDFAQRRESVEHVLPDLGDILELLSPRLAWEETWECLQQHLSEFRE